MNFDFFVHSNGFRNFSACFFSFSNLKILMNEFFVFYFDEFARKQRQNALNEVTVFLKEKDGVEFVVCKHKKELSRKAV